MKTNHARSRPPWRVLAVYAGVLVLLFWFFAMVAHFLRVNQTPWEGFAIPDDTKVARELLAQKFTGPAYFQPGHEAGLPPGPDISVDSARRQIARIVEERRLPADASLKIEKLIDKLTVNSSSRVVGVDHVNTLQLNLALDELR